MEQNDKAMTCAFGTCQAREFTVRVALDHQHGRFMFCSLWHAIAWLIEEGVSRGPAAGPEILDLIDNCQTMQEEMTAAMARLRGD